VNNPEAFLTTVVSRLSLDKLRRVKARREVYQGPWLPEPVSAETDPQAAAAFADSLSLAFLVVLETLSPLERAAFVLREVFDEPYATVAEILGREEPAVRQLVDQARQRVNEGGARYRADQATQAEVVRRCLLACQSADLDGLLAILAPDVVLVSDGGGAAPAPARPIQGRDKVARLLIGFTVKAPPGTEPNFEVFNGQLGIVTRVGGRATNAVAFTIRDGTVQTLLLIANPTKLAALDPSGHSRLQ
jgi:RNA polymerase sigma-70 factor (ECF subfamily)